MHSCVLLIVYILGLLFIYVFPHSLLSHCGPVPFERPSAK